MKTIYVVGFIFDDKMENVVLIRKNKPAWQRGFLNGVGGKLESFETPLNAMVRECGEEAGVFMPQERWYELAVLTFDYAIVNFFFCKDETAWRNAKTKTSEEIEKIMTNDLDNFDMIQNLRWLIPLAIDSCNENCLGLPLRLKYKRTL